MKSVKKPGDRVQRKQKYSEESVQKALQAIKDGMSKKLASKTYHVPRSTLQFKTKFPDKKSRPGPSTILTTSEELCLKQWLLDCSKRGFPNQKDDVLASVGEFLKKSDRPNPFKNGKPGYKWYTLFLARHPDIVTRIPESITASTAAVADDIKHWFISIEKYLIDNNISDILKDPKRIYNGDETSFCLCPKTGVVSAARTDKVYEIDNAPAKMSLTVLLTFGADGSIAPPLVIFPLNHLPSNLRSTIPLDWGIGLSDNGWMKSDIFKAYIENIFHPHLVKKGIEFPIIYFVDGLKTHLTYEVSEVCSKLNIVLIALHPNCTKILQPADLSAFKPLTTGWQKTVLAWHHNHPSQVVTKTEFVPLLKKTIDKAIDPSIIINGYRATSLYPFKKDVKDYTKCLDKNKIQHDEDQCGEKEQSDLNEIKMTFSDFKAVINEEKLRMLENGKDVDEDLNKVYQFFTKKQKVQEEPKDCINHVTITDDVDNEIVMTQTDDTIQDIQHYEPIVFVEVSRES